MPSEIKEKIKRLKEVEAILFDLDDTLVMSYYSDKMGIKVSLDTLKQYNSIEMPDSRLNSMLRSIKEEHEKPFLDSDSFNRLLEKLGIADLALATRMGIAYKDVFIATMRLYPDVMPFLKLLAWVATETGIMVGIISNGEVFNQYEKLVRGAIREYFWTIHISGIKDNSMKKPYPQIFERSIEACQTEPDKAIYIGDRLETDILGANKAGLFSIRIRRGRYKDEEKKDFDLGELNKKYPGMDIRSLDELEPQFEIKSLDELKVYFEKE